MTAVYEDQSDTFEAATDGTVDTSEPSGSVENSLLVAVQVYNSTNNPTLNTNWNNIGVGSGLSLGVRASWLIRGASAPDLSFVFSSGQEARVYIARISGHDLTTPINASDFSIDTDNAPDPGENDCPDITPIVDDCLILRIACNRSVAINFATVTKVYDSEPDGPGSEANVAVGTEVIASQTASGLENAERSTGVGGVHTYSIAIAPAVILSAQGKPLRGSLRQGLRKGLST